MSTPPVVTHLRHVAGGGGGADAVILQDLSQIDPSRFRSQVILLRKWSEAPAAMIGRLRDLGVSCHDLPGRAVLDVGQLLRAARLIRDSGARVLHCHDPKTSVYGVLLHTLVPRTMLVATLHGWTVKVRREIIYNWAAVQALKRFDAVLTVSAALQREALRSGLKGVRLLPNAIDIDLWSTARTPSPGVARPPSSDAVGFVGRLSPEKGALDFIRIARQISDRRERCEFFVAGEGPERPAMAALAAAAGLGGRVHFLGRLDQTALRKLYRSLDVVLVPSHTEGLPMVVLEALAMSIPVVASDVGGVGEIIQHGIHGLLAPSGDIDSLAAHMLRLLEDSALRERIGAAGRERVKSRYSLSDRITAIETLYQEVTDLDRPPAATSS